MNKKNHRQCCIQSIELFATLKLPQAFKIFLIQTFVIFLKSKRFISLGHRKKNVPHKKSFICSVKLNCIIFKILSFEDGYLCSKCGQSRFLQHFQKVNVLWLLVIARKIFLINFSFESFIYSIKLNCVVYKILSFKVG